MTDTPLPQTTKAVAIKSGQIWLPAQRFRAKARVVEWTGTDRFCGNSVRYRPTDERLGATIQFKAFVAWIRKTEATCHE